MATLCEERAQMMSVLADFICEESGHAEPYFNAIDAEEIRQQIDELLDDCDLLSALWRHLVKKISEQLAGNERVDLRKLRDGAMTAIEKAIRAFDSTANDIQYANAQGLCIRDGSLRIAIREARNIKKWIETWPGSDTTRRDRVLAEIAAGSPDADFSR